MQGQKAFLDQLEPPLAAPGPQIAWLTQTELVGTVVQFGALPGYNEI